MSDCAGVKLTTCRAALDSHTFSFLTLKNKQNNKQLNVHRNYGKLIQANKLTSVTKVLFKPL